MNTDIFEEEAELYNCKMRLLMWLYEELKINPKYRDVINSKGKELPLNI